MNTPKSVTYRVKLSSDKVAQIRNDFPGKQVVLDSLLNQQGRHFNMLLDDATAQTIKNEFGEALYDYLFYKAYDLKPEKYFSYFLQLREILKLPKSEVKSILEVGPGYNILRALLELYGYDISTMDVKPEHVPTIQGNLLHMPDGVGCYDLVCAFQVLQHLPYKYFCDAIRNICKCSKHYLFLSLPCPTNNIFLQLRSEIVHRFFRRFSFDWKFQLQLPIRPLNPRQIAFEKNPDKHNPHYWEVNRISYSKKKVLHDIEKCGVTILKQFHNYLHPYHWFILGEVRKGE